MGQKKQQTSYYDVQPLRSAIEIEDMKDSLRRWCSERDRFLFLFGINTGLRVSDIVPIKVGQVRNKRRAVIIEQKTGKKREITINKSLAEEVGTYIKGMNDNDYLFPSRKGNGHITTTQAYRQFVKAGNMIDRTDIGTHTMRKTFGYHYYKRTKDVATLMNIFNHSSTSITKQYIGISQEEIDESLKDFFL